MNNAAGPLIRSISIRDLFGRRSYDIELPSTDGQADRLLLLHGDNGSGKTTVLRLVWNALSPADNKGHRSFIGRTPFRELMIQLSDGAVINVTKEDGLVGDFRINLRRPGLDDLVSHYETDEHFSVSRISPDPRLLADEARHRGLRVTRELANYRARYLAFEAERTAERGYLEYLNDAVRTPLFLADDRSLYSDDPDLQRTREMLSRRDDPNHRDDEQLSRLVFRELRVTIRRVNDLLRGLTLGGQNDGSANSNAIYAAVLRQLTNPTPILAPGVQHPPALTQLQRIGEIAPGFERFGLVPPFDATEFTEPLKVARERSAELGDLAERIVTPYLSSLDARYTALREAHDLLQALVPTINDFLSEKELTFSPRQGLKIATSDGEQLEVESLSSGERQLLMLLCTTLLARVDTRLFIIDEPELSLGVEWQRKILDALMALTEGTGVQFIVATHSIEIISGRPASLVQLRSK